MFDMVNKIIDSFLNNLKVFQPGPPGDYFDSQKSKKVVINGMTGRKTEANVKAKNSLLSWVINAKK